MSSLRIQGQWTTQTASLGSFLSGQSRCSLSLFFRANRIEPGTTFVAASAGESPLRIFINNIGQIDILINGVGGGLERGIPYTPGTGVQLGISWDASGSQIIWFQGATWGGTTGLGNTVTSNANLVLGLATAFGTVDYQIADLSILHGATWDSTDFADLASRAKDPSQVSTPATYWWTLGGTANATADPATDAGFLDQMGSGIRFSAPTGAGTGVYSPDTLQTESDAAWLDAYVSRSGRLFFVLTGGHHTGYEMVGNAGSHLYTVASVRRTADGSGYTSPTATLSGGSPSRAAVLTAEATAGGSVNVGVYDGGDGYRDTDSLAVVVTDPTGSGATFAIRLGGALSTVTALSGTQPTVKKNGVAVALNPMASTAGAFWSSVNHLLPWVAYQIAESDAFAPGDVATWSAPAGWASIANGGLPAVAANTSAANYAGTLEPAFQVPRTGLSMVVGVMGTQGAISYYVTSHLANRRLHANNPGQGGGSRSYTLDGGLVSWTTGANPSTHIADIGTNANFLDNHGLPFLSGPTLISDGGGSGAVLIPIISGGVIQSIVIDPSNRGTAYPDSGTVAILHGGGWGATATYTATGGAIQTATVTAGGGGYSDGIWDLGYGDSDPSNATILALTNGAAANIWISLQGLPSPLGDRWTSTGGGASITKAWYNCLAGASPANWSPGVELTYDGGAVVGGVHTNGATNIRIAPPGATLAQCAGFGPDPHSLEWLSFGDGKYCGVIRWMQSQLGGGATSSIIDYSRMPQPGNWAFNGPIEYLAPAATLADQGKLTVAVSSIRLYDPTVSPHVYIDTLQPGVTAAPGGSPAAYMWTPADWSWSLINGDITLGDPIECLTATPHGLKTGQLLWTDGSAPPTLLNRFTWAWVTGPNTFLMVGMGGATASSSAAFGVFTIDPSPGTVPVEACCEFTNALPGCAAWFSIGTSATDAHVDAFCDAILATLDTGHKCYIELGNELWNFGYPSSVWGLLVGKLSGLGLDMHQAHTARAALVHARCTAKFTAAGRASDLVRVFGTQYGGAYISQEIIDYANAHSIPIDALAIAPYLDASSGAFFNNDSGELSWEIAAASLAPNDVRSLQYGTAWPWTMAEFHDAWKPHVLYNTSERDLLAGHNSVLDSYTAGPRPALICYEGGIGQQDILPVVGTGGGLTAPHDGLAHDFLFSPGMLDLVTTWHLLMAKSGVTATAYTALAGAYPAWNGLYTLVQHSGMHAGIGDGSDGKGINEFWVDDGECHLLQNVAPALAGLQAFGALASPTPGALEFTISSGFNVRAQVAVHTDFNRIVSSGLSLAPAVSLAPTHNYVVATGFNLRPQVSTVPATYQYVLSAGLDLHAQVMVSADRHYAVSATLGLHPEVSAESGTPVPLGRFRLGDVVPIPFTPTAPPDAPPEATISGPAAEQVRPMATWDGGQTFFCHERLTQPYDVGAHAIAVTSSAGRADYTFDVVEGGDRGSTVIALHYVSGPDGSQVIAQLASGQLVLGRNPHL
jgi:hypothetical protein